MYTGIPLYQGSSPAEKLREPGRSDGMPRDILCVVLYLCVVLIIELLPMQSAYSALSADKAVVVVLDATETTDRH